MLQQASWYLIINCFLPIITITYTLRTAYIPQISGHLTFNRIHPFTGPHSAVSNVSCYRCMSDCRSRSRKFDPSPVPYFRGDWSWNNFYRHSPPFCLIIQEGLLSVTSESMYLNNFKLAQEKMWIGELTVPPWLVNWPSHHDHSCWLLT